MSDHSTTTISDIKGVLVAFGLQIALCSGLLIAFSIIRPLYKKVYQPKVEFAPNDYKKPPSLSASPSAWIWPAFRISEMNMNDQLGMDSIMFLRIILTCFRFFAGALIIAIPLLVFNFYSPKITQRSGYDQYSIENVTAASLPLLTMQNLEPGSNYYYMYSLITFICSCYAYLLFYWTWQDYISLRKIYVKSSDYLESSHSRTLLFSGVSRKILRRAEIVDLVLNLYPEAQIDQIVYGRETKALALYCKKHAELNHKMEKVLDKFFSGGTRSKVNSKGMLGQFTFSGENRDSIEFYGESLIDLEEKIYELRARGDEAFSFSSYAFVSFKDLKSVQRILGSIRHPSSYITDRMNASMAKIRECPPYEDIIWKNLRIDKRDKFLRRFFMWTLTAGLTLGWTAVISFISGIADMQKIGRFAPKFAASVRESQTATIILESIIAPGLIVLALILLQLFLYYASLFQGIVTWNGLYKSVLIKFYFFQIYQFFLFITLSTTWEYFQNPNLFKDIRKSVVTGFIRNSTFYINYTIINFAGYCMEILQGNQLFIIWFYNKFFHLTPRDVYILNKAPELQMSFTLSTMLVLFLFCISYSVVAPLIVPFAVIIFGLAYIVFKYQQIYVYQTRHESGGTWWPKTFNLLCFSVGFFQLMTGGSIYILTATASNNSNGRISASLVFLQILITVIYWYYITARFQVLSSSIETTTPLNSNFNLNELFYHPAIGDPLEKVWIKNEYSDQLSHVYTPKYSSVIHYIVTHRIQNDRLTRLVSQRSKAFGNRHKNDINPETSHPPEVLMALNGEY